MVPKIDSVNDINALSVQGIKTDINVLPNELILEIFSLLNVVTLEKSCEVSKTWKELANDPIVCKKLVYREIAFSNENWVLCFGKDIVKDEDKKEEFSSLPGNILEILKSPCPIFSGKKVIDTHMLVRIPKTINSQLLTLNSLGQLAKRYFPNNTTGY